MYAGVCSRLFLVMWEVLIFYTKGKERKKEEEEENERMMIDGW